MSNKKEEILNDSLNLSEIEFLGDNLGNVYKAMDIYSKQQAIAFAEWTQKNYFEQDDDGFWYKWMLRSKEEQTYTTEQLYQLFLQSQKQ
jgi:hypothetical protein